MMNRVRIHPVFTCLLVSFVLLSGKAQAQTSSEERVVGYVAPELQEVRMEQKYDAQIPLDLALTDSDGREVTIADLLDDERPVIVNFVYYNCPMLCGLISGAMVNGLRDVDWTAGQDFIILTISFDHREGPALAAHNKKSYLRAYNRDGAGDGWYFLTGSKENVREIATAVGFHYRWSEERNDFNHPMGLIVLTPDGRVARYLSQYSGSPPAFPAKTMRMALAEAADGKIGTLTDRMSNQFFLTCTTFDPDEGSYVASAIGIMKIGGLVILLTVGSGIIGLFIYEARKRSRTNRTTVNPAT